MKPHILKCYFVRKCCSIIKSPFSITYTAATTLLTTFCSPFEPKGLCCSKIRRGLMAARAPVVNERLLVALAVRYSWKGSRGCCWWGGEAGVCFPAGCSVAVFFNGADIYCRGLLRNPEMGRAAGVRPYRLWSSLEMDLLSPEIWKCSPRSEAGSLRGAPQRLRITDRDSERRGAPAETHLFFSFLPGELISTAAPFRHR